jgi:hypothetical protein
MSGLRTSGLGLVVAAAALTGCGTGADRDQARSVVARFYEAIRSKDGAQACAQLGAGARKALESESGRFCRVAILDAKLQPAAVVVARVYATSAKVDVASGESAFLDREPEGWRISAAGCRPTAGKPRSRPFECEVEA